MRISKLAKAENRRKILQSAAQLFVAKGYEVTTREIAAAAGIAPSSMFNYFKTKEDLAMAIVAEAFEEGRSIYRQLLTGKEVLDEDLFLLIASELRQLRPYQKFVGTVVDKSMGFSIEQSHCPEGHQVKEEHLRMVQEIISRHGSFEAPEPIISTLYLALYIGILVYWSNDTSRNQEETLALIDYSLKLFTKTISGE